MSPTGHAEVLLENRPSGNTVVHYTLGHEIIAWTSKLSLSPVEATKLYITDALGSVRATSELQTTSSVTRTASGSYDSFGNATSGQYDLNNFIGYAGQWRDATGEIYSRARYYQPATGTFTTLDPFVGNPQSPLSLHKYLYAHADPINGKDPSGWAALFTPMEGSLIHEVIVAQYYSEHPFDWIETDTPAKLGVPGSKSWTSKPDIFNRTQRSYAEIKPNTFRGKKDGTDQLNAYSDAFRTFGYKPEPTWPVAPRMLSFNGLVVSYWHDDLPGLILYGAEARDRQMVPAFVRQAIESYSEEIALIAATTAILASESPSVFARILLPASIQTPIPTLIRATTTLASASRSIDGARLESSIGLAASVAIMVGF
jgi:RHS repeat-associated protein